MTVPLKLLQRIGLVEQDWRKEPHLLLKGGFRANVFFCIAVDSISNHVKPYWPTECVTTSDGEDPGGKQKLKVETKVNVELHRENQVNHSNEAPRENENEGQQKENKPIQQQNNQHPEQRKGKSANPVH